jgi:hypothetical protein
MTDDEFAQYKMITNQRIMDLALQVGLLQETVDRLMQQPAIGGTFAPLAEIEKLQVQIFHTETLTTNQKRGGLTHWSLKIETWHRAARQPGIDIALIAPAEFLSNLQKRRAPDEIIKLAELMHPYTLGGIVRRKLINGGREYMPSQCVILLGHLLGMEHVELVLLIGDQQQLITGFTAAKGSKRGSALWFSKWSR